VTTNAWRPRVLDQQGQVDHRYARTVERFLGRYKSAETRRKYAAYLDSYCAWLERSQEMTPDQAVTDVVSEHLDDYLYYLQQPHADGHPGDCWTDCTAVPYSPEGLAPKISAVRSWYTYLVKSGVRSANPAAALLMPDVPDKEQRVFLPGEVSAIHANARALGLREEVLSGMFFGMGLRCQDSAGALAENYHNLGGQKRRLGAYRKGSSWQLLDVPYALVPALDELLDGRTSGPILLPRGCEDPATQKPVAPSTLFRSLQKIGRNAGFPDIATHDGKRTATTLASTHPGLPFDRLVRYFNHKNPKTTLGYIHTGRLLGPGEHRNPIGIDWDTQAP
jgi:hypothetical protein